MTVLDPLEEMASLEAVGARLEAIARDFPSPSAVSGPDVDRAREQIPLICRTLEDAAGALYSRLDRSGRPITPKEVGRGLQSLVDDARDPAFAAVMATVLDPVGVGLLARAIDDLEAIALRLRAG